MKIYMGKAGQLAEKLATERNAEVRRHLSDIDRYAPESLLGPSPKSEKHGASRTSLSTSNDGTQSAEVEGSVGDMHERYDFQDRLEGSELVEIAGTSKIEVENAKLKAELASKIALLCSMSTELDYESLDDSKLENILKTAAEKTSEALHLKDEYEKHLQSIIKVKQMQCESYEKRIQELEQRLSDQYLRGHKHSPEDDRAGSAVSIAKTDDENKSGSISGWRNAHASCNGRGLLCI
ncbi:UNVERIFIED_CONTAM: Autophagy-related protein 11 [Sesamum radiatum]|uniref:Autophagy-related protein 11 n=1 Tax=Sesamum radiatum TaxID=300843 RepID=A0AAW2N9L7_SESRA